MHLLSPLALLVGQSLAFTSHLKRPSSSVKLFSVSDNKVEFPQAMRWNGTDTYRNANGEQQAPSSTADKQLSDILSIDPADIEIVTIDTPVEETVVMEPDMIQRLPFVSMFRGSANYIANHRNTLAVYHIPGGLLDMPDANVFRDLMNDIALTWLLGMKIVLVVGCRHQIEKRVKDAGRFHGLRVTDEETLRIVKEEAGYVRFEVERQLARSLRMQSGGASSGGGGGGASAGGSSGHGYYDGNVVSGNFYSAQPFGVLDGVDYK
jgi:hypothetical protein